MWNRLFCRIRVVESNFLEIPNKEGCCGEKYGSSLVRPLFCSSLLCAILFLQHVNAECGYYSLFITFGIIPLTKWYGVWVLHLSLVTIFIRSIFRKIRSIFFLSTKIYKWKNLLPKVKRVLSIFVAPILQPSVNDPLRTYYFNTLK